MPYFGAAAHLCSVSHDEHGLSYADVTRQLLGRIAPSSFNREGAHVMHTGTPGSATGLAFEIGVFLTPDGRVFF